MVANKSPKKTVTTKNKRNQEYCSLFLTIGAGSLIVMVTAVWYAITYLDKMSGILGFLVFIYGLSFLALIIFGVIAIKKEGDTLGLIVSILFVIVMTCLILFLLILFSIITGFNVGFNSPLNITSST